MSAYARLVGYVYFAVTVACIVAGSVTTLAARSTAIQAIHMLHVPLGSTFGDEGVVRIEGWDVLDTGVAVGIAVALVTLVAWALQRGRSGWGFIGSMTTLIALAVLCFDNYAVSGIFGIANCIDCNSLWGEAQHDVNIAGWLYAVAAILTMAALTRFARVSHQVLE